MSSHSEREIFPHQAHHAGRAIEGSTRGVPRGSRGHADGRPGFRIELLGIDYPKPGVSSIEIWLVKD
jgi:hypothetical protein